MKNFLRISFLVIVCLIFSSISYAQEQCPSTHLIFGTGDQAGTYSKMFQNIKEYCPNLCEFTETTGGFQNVNLLTRKKIEAGLVPEDVLEFTKRTDPLVSKSVRALVALHINALHIIVMKDGTTIQKSGYLSSFSKGETVNVRDIRDLRNRRVAVFASALITGEMLNERLQLQMEFIKVDKKEDGFDLLKNGDVFAFMTTGGWPISWVSNADPKLYSLANIEETEARKLGAPFISTRLNYEKLGVFGVSTVGARNIIAVWNYSSPKRVAQIMELKACITNSLQDIKEMRGSHASWSDVENLEDFTWMKYEDVVKK